MPGVKPNMRHLGERGPGVGRAETTRLSLTISRSVPAFLQGPRWQ